MAYFMSILRSSLYLGLSVVSRVFCVAFCTLSLACVLLRLAFCAKSLAPRRSHLVQCAFLLRFAHASFSPPPFMCAVPCLLCLLCLPFAHCCHALPRAFCSSGCASSALSVASDLVRRASSPCLLAVATCTLSFVPCLACLLRLPVAPCPFHTVVVRVVSCNLAFACCLARPAST